MGWKTITKLNNMWPNDTIMDANKHDNEDQ